MIQRQLFSGLFYFRSLAHSLVRTWKLPLSFIPQQTDSLGTSKASLNLFPNLPNVAPVFPGVTPIEGLSFT